MRITIGLVVGFIVLLTAFTNCSNPIGSGKLGSLNLASQCPSTSIKGSLDSLSSKPYPFATSKVQIPQNYTASAKLSAQHEEYVALVSHNCLENSGGEPAAAVSRQIASVPPPAGHDIWVHKVSAEDFNVNDNVQVASAEQDPCLIGISPNQVYHRSFVASDLNDSLYNTQRHLPVLSHAASIGYFYHQTYGIQDPMNNAPLVKVGVIDTGVHYDHPDINANMFRGPNGYGVDASTLGVGGVTPVYDGKDVDETVSHGTHVAGIIAGRGGNAMGVSGVAPFGVKIVPINVFFKNDPTDTDVVSDTATVTKGILFAVQQNLDVINMSLGGRVTDPALEAALRQAIDAGIFIAVAAGNATQTTPAQELNANFRYYPAYYGADLNGMVTVGSIDTSSGNRSFFSHYGTVRVEIAAYGSEGNNTGILSTFSTSDFNRLQGTSQATPQVAAAAALIIALVKQNGLPKPSAAQIENMILASARKVAGLSDEFKDGNVLNLENLGKVVNQNYPQTAGLPATSPNPASCN